MLIEPENRWAIDRGIPWAIRANLRYVIEGHPLSRPLFDSSNGTGNGRVQ
jgi:hypothetical protein